MMTPAQVPARTARRPLAWLTSLRWRERWVLGLWLVIAVVVWNGLYDLLLARSTQTYLFETAIHQAGQGPYVDLTETLDDAVVYASWISTLWAALLLMAGVFTIWTVRQAGPSGVPEPRQ